MKLYSCGRVEKRKSEACDFVVNSFKDLDNKIIPFFLKYPLQGTKLLDFEDFNKIVQIMKIKDHLTKQGFEIIKYIKTGMNTNRL